MKRFVRVRIESRQGSETAVHAAKGELYAKGDAYYLRYAEPDSALGNTMATVKWDNRQLKIMRRGDVHSELTFESGSRTRGSYAIQQGRFELQCYTHGIERKLKDGLGSLSWSYDLYADGVHAGRFRLRLSIEEDTAS